MTESFAHPFSTIEEISAMDVTKLRNGAVKLSSKDVRLLRLKPLCFRHPQRLLEQYNEVKIFCEVEVTSRRQCPAYTALSYAWGSQREARPICIGHSIVQISSNLEEALQELRDEYFDVMLWVDQICINQADEEEKASQVKEMKATYAKATRVVAWVGTAADDSDLIIAHLNYIGQRASSDNDNLSKKAFQKIIKTTFDGALPSLADPQSLERLSIAFRKFCQRLYWRRLWVLQEFAVARTIDIACGKAIISEAHLRRARACVARVSYYLEWVDRENRDDNFVKLGYKIVQAYTSPTSSFLDGIITQRERYQGAKDGKMGLFYVLVSSLVLECDHNHPECTDPRDRIFAVLGLAGDVSSYPNFPDYSSSCEEVYTESTKRILDQGFVDIISYCQPSRDKSLPTWVPDWRNMTFAPIAYHAWNDALTTPACGTVSELPTVTVDSSGILTLSGTVVDTIKEFGSLWEPDWVGDLDPTDCHRYFQEIKRFTAQSTRISVEEEEAATARIIIADWEFASEPARCEDSFTLDSYRRLEASFGAANTSQDDIRMYDKDTWYRRAMHFLRPCRPFISTSGFVGLAPCHVQNGDVICIFLGGSVPYIIREQSDGIYELIGDAHVQGIMYGEYMEETPEITEFCLK